MRQAPFVIMSFQLSTIKKVFYVCLYDYRIFFLLQRSFKMYYSSFSRIYSVMRIEQSFSSYINMISIIQIFFC